MFQNYLKIGWRNLWKNKTFSGINLAGLTLGTACCLYILLYVHDQFSYDKHHGDASRIYRVVSDLGGMGPDIFTATTSPPIPPTLAREFPEVDDWTRVVNPPDVSHSILSWSNRSFYETNGYYVDSTFFRFFDYHFTAGSAEKCLNEPYTVVLTAPVAEKLFGTQNPVGQTILINNTYGRNEFKVTGVVDASLGKSHIDAHYYAAMNSGGIGEYVRQNTEYAGQNFIYGYIKLHPAARPGAVADKFPEFLEKHAGTQMRERGMFKHIRLEPLTGIHTGSGRDHELSPSVSSSKLYLLLAIAGFIQCIACINFMNLTTARSTRRAKEVGVRKVLGANRGLLVRQFLAESMLLSGIAILLAAPIVWLTMPELNRLTGSTVVFDLSRHWSISLFILGLVLCTGLLAGSYPAIYLSGFKPAAVLKGLLGNRMSAAGLRRGLVVAQFAIAIVLMMGALVANQQLHFLDTKDLGFERKQKIIVPFRTQESREQVKPFKQAVRGLAEVQDAAAFRSCPGMPIINDFNLYTEGKTMEQSLNLAFTMCDENYQNTLGLSLLKGRWLTAADTSNQVVLNEAAAQFFGYTAETAVGKFLYRDEEGQRASHPIVGVIRNYHHASLYRDIQPFAYYYIPDGYQFNAMISLKTDDYARVLPKLEACWKQVLPELPFEYSYLDQQLEQQYEADQTLANIVGAFTGMALLISCLGLFGLSVFMAEQRNKEIGVRKVLGASVGALVGLLSADFVRLVLLSLLIAIPVSYYLMNRWLEEFAVRIAISWWMYALAGSIAVLVAFLTVSFQSVRAALSNPVQSLRSE
ncbi:MAG: ABC transporter permease [Saprospiraceae bacterium]|nr:ABC transporter permease [Saprospiraceae bacterium]